MFFGNMFGPPRSPVTFERHPDTPHGCCHGVISMVKCWGSLLQLRHQTSDVDVGLSHGELRDLGSVNLRCHPTSSSIPCFFLLRNFSPNRNHWGQCVARKFLAAPDESSPTHPAPQLFWVQSAGHKLLVWIWMVFFFDPYGFGNGVTPHSMAQKNGKPDFQPIGVCFPFQQHPQIDLWLVSASLLHPPNIWRRFLLGQTKQVTSTAANFATDGLCRLGYITNNNAMTGCENGNIMEYPILKFHSRYWTPKNASFWELQFRLVIENEIHGFCGVIIRSWDVPSSRNEPLDPLV